MENKKRLIDADAEIEAIKKYACKDCESYDGIKCRSCWADDLISWIEDAPKVDAVEVVHGRWVFGTANHREYMKCSECLHSYTPDGTFCYCPNCGAKMDGDGNGT